LKLILFILNNYLIANIQIENRMHGGNKRKD